MQLFIGHFGTARTALSSKNRFLSVDEQAAISALLSLFLSCFSRFPEITVQPSIHKKICATQHIRCTSKSRSISKCWSSWRYCRDIATSHMKCYTDRHSFGAVAWQVANIAKFPKSEGCKKVPKKLFWSEFSRNVPSYGEQRNFLKLVVFFSGFCASKSGCADSFRIDLFSEACIYEICIKILSGNKWHLERERMRRGSMAQPVKFFKI